MKEIRDNDVPLVNYPLEIYLNKTDEAYEAHYNAVNEAGEKALENNVKGAVQLGIALYAIGAFVVLTLILLFF